MKPMFPHTVDSTMLAAFRSCPQKYFRTYVEHWKPQNESVHLVAGGAFAKGLEVGRRAYFEGIVAVPIPKSEGGFSWGEEKISPGNRTRSEEAALHALVAAYGDFECPADSAKSVERMCGALDFYWQQYPLGADGAEPIQLPDGRRGIEFSFAHPLDIQHPVTGDPILYTGRLDMIADFAGGVYNFDDKTTSQLGASWPRQWENRSQFTGYDWAVAEAYGIKPAGTIVRGVSILKTKYDTMQAITHRPEWEVERWYKQTLLDVRRMIAAWEAGWWDYNLDHACAEYGGCNLLQICKSAEPGVWLPMYFEKRVWDPLARRELSVEEWEASWGHQTDLSMS